MGLAGGHVQVEARQYRQGATWRFPSGEFHLGVTLDPIHKIHVAKHHVAPNRRDQTAGTGDDAGRDLQQIEDANHRCRGTLIQVEHLTHAGERPEQPLGHEHQCGKHSHRKRACDGGAAADQQGHHECGQDGHADQRDEC